MKKSLLLFAFCFMSCGLFAQVIKPDKIITPDGPNTQVYWNSKFKTAIMPHFSLSHHPASQDTTGDFFLNTDGGDYRVYVKGPDGTRRALANYEDIASAGGVLHVNDSTSMPGYVTNWALKDSLKRSIILFSRRFKYDIDSAIDINLDSAATSLNNFAVFKNANGDLVTPNINFSTATNTVIFNGIKVNANGGLKVTGLATLDSLRMTSGVHSSVFNPQSMNLKTTGYEADISPNHWAMTNGDTTVKYLDIKSSTDTLRVVGTIPWAFEDQAVIYRTPTDNHDITNKIYVDARTLKQVYFLNQTLHTLRLINYTDNTRTTILSQIDVLAGQTVNTNFLNTDNVYTITNLGAGFHDDAYASFDNGLTWALFDYNNNQFTGSTFNGGASSFWLTLTEHDATRIAPNINGNYQPLGSYVTTETDPTVPSYAKTLTTFSVIQASTDPLYYPLSSNPSNYITPSSTNVLTNKSGNISQWTNDSGYITGSSITYNNGVQKVSSTVSMGGTLSGNVAVNLGGHNIRFLGTTTNDGAGFNIIQGNSGASTVIDSVFGIFSSVHYHSTFVQLGKGFGFNVFNDDAVTASSISVDNTSGIVFKDGILTHGPVNFADYSTYEIANDNALMSRKAVRTYGNTLWIATGSSAPPSGTAAGELAGTYPNPTLLNSAVIAKVLTGYSSGPGTVSSSDNILQAFQKIDGNEIADAANIATNTSAIAGKQATLTGPGYVKQVSGSPTYVTAIPNADLANSTLSGISLGSNLANLTAGRGVILPNYNGGTTQAVILDTTQNYNWLKAQTITKTGLATTPTDGFILQNTTASLVGIQIQYAPSTLYVGHAWTTNAGGSDITTRMRMTYEPVASTTATASSNLILQFDSGSGSFSDRVTFGSGGQITGTTLVLNGTGIAAASSLGYSQNNTTAATAGVPIQYSYAMQQGGTGYTGSTSQTALFKWEVRPVNGTTPITANWVLATNIAGAGFNDRFTFTDVGGFTAAGNVTAGGYIANSSTAYSSSTTTATSNFFAYGTSAIGLTNASMQIGTSTQVRNRAGMNGQSSTTMSASDSYVAWSVDKMPITLGPSGTTDWLVVSGALGWGTISNPNSVTINHTAVGYFGASATVGTVNYGVYSEGNIFSNTTINLKSYTVATLPAVHVAGATAYVTDALTPAFGATLVGGGAVVTKAFDNGTNWIAE